MEKRFMTKATVLRSVVLLLRLLQSGNELLKASVKQYIFNEGRKSLALQQFDKWLQMGEELSISSNEMANFLVLM